MALTVEDGTGKALADAYISVDEFKTFCTARAYRWEDWEDFQIEAAIRQATGWIDTQARYKGARLLATQALEFPRTGLFDWSGHEVTGVPLRAKQACAELAFKGVTEPLYQDLDRGGRITSESIGSISVSYADDAPGGKSWTFATNLMAQYVRNAGTDTTNVLWTEPVLPAQFSVGMSDYPGDAEVDDL